MGFGSSKQHLVPSHRTLLQVCIEIVLYSTRAGPRKNNARFGPSTVQDYFFTLRYALVSVRLLGTRCCLLFCFFLFFFVGDQTSLNNEMRATYSPGKDKQEGKAGAMG